MRHFVFLFLVFFFLMMHVSFVQANERWAQLNANQIGGIINETIVLINLIKKEEGETNIKTIQLMVKRMQLYNMNKEYEQLKKVLKALKYELHFIKIRTSVVYGKLVPRINTKKEIEALKFVNKVRFLANSIIKRIEFLVK